MRTHLFISPAEEAAIKAIARDCGLTIDAMMTSWARYIIEMAQTAHIDNILFFAPDGESEVVDMCLTQGEQRYRTVLPLWDYTRSELKRVTEEAGEEGKWSLMLAAMMDRDDYMDIVRDSVRRDAIAGTPDETRLQRISEIRNTHLSHDRQNVFTGWCTRCRNKMDDQEIIHEILHADGARALAAEQFAPAPDKVGDHGVPPESE